MENDFLWPETSEDPFSDWIYELCDNDVQIYRTLSGEIIKLYFQGVHPTEIERRMNHAIFGDTTKTTSNESICKRKEQESPHRHSKPTA